MPDYFDGGVQIIFVPLGHFEANLSTTPSGLPSLPSSRRLRRAVIRVSEDATFTDDGTDPTASHGMPILADEILVYDSEFDKIKFWSGASAVLHVAYYGT